MPSAWSVTFKLHSSVTGATVAGARIALAAFVDDVVSAVEGSLDPRVDDVVSTTTDPAGDGVVDGGAACPETVERLPQHARTPYAPARVRTCVTRRTHWRTFACVPFRLAPPC